MPTRAIKAIFFARFHHEKGSTVLHQVPEGSITPSASPSALSQPLISFDSIASFLIPTQQFCDRLLTFCANHNRVIGYPVCIREGRYSRNEFIFNFALVVDETLVEWTCYGDVVRKLGRLLRGLEEQGGFVSREEEGMWEEENAGRGYPSVESKVYALCEMVLEDLNNYAECMIPIDESNTINLKLFRPQPPPPPIHSYQVPLLTISLSSLTSPISSDLTLTRVLPFVNGINSVAHIAQLADTDLSLTRKAIQHLVYYGCLILLDIFSFGAVYAPTAEIGAFVMEKSVQEECARYVRVPRMRIGSKSVRVGSEATFRDRSRDDRSSISSETSQWSNISKLGRTDLDNHTSAPSQSSHPPLSTDNDDFQISHLDLITLYTSLRQGLPLKTFVLENLDLLIGIDIRRFITFGIIKGFLYRVHRYAIATHSALPPAPPTSLQSHVPSAATSSTANADQGTIRGAAGVIPQQMAMHHKPSISSVLTNSTASTAHPNISMGAPSSSTQTSSTIHDSSQFHTHPRTSEIRPNPYAHTEVPHHSQSHSRLDSIASAGHGEGTGIDGEDGLDRDGLPLVRFLDGMHAFDEICMEVGKSEKWVEERVRRGWGADCQFVWR